VQRLFGQVEIPQQADQGRQHPPRLVTVEAGQQFMQRFGGVHGFPSFD
jgi:hypothetical protein